jgi:hypothetical protein
MARADGAARCLAALWRWSWTQDSDLGVFHFIISTIQLVLPVVGRSRVVVLSVVIVLSNVFQPQYLPSEFESL